MVSALMILNSSYTGARDLTWTDSPDTHVGYNIYRAQDAPVEWTKLNSTAVPGTFYRDQTVLEVQEFIPTTNDWVINTPAQMRGIKLPNTPFSDHVAGKPMLASHPDDAQIEVTYRDGTKKLYPPAIIDAMDRTLWLRQDRVLEGNGAVSRTLYIDYANAVTFKAIYKHLVNHVDLDITQTRTFYTVVPVGADGGNLHAPGAFGTQIMDTQQIDRMSWEFAPMVQRNAFLLEQTAEPAYIFFRRTRGQICECTKNGVEEPRTSCPSCYGVGIVGGYFGPYDFPFLDPDTAILTTVEEGGRKVDRQSRSFIGPTPYINRGDIIVRYNGERMVITAVTYKTPRGIRLQQDFDVELLKPGDLRYRIPIKTPLPITVYNPVSETDLTDGTSPATPIFRTDTVPGKQWENPDKQLGRTVAWGRLQS